MEKRQRSGSRQVKLRRDPDFVYESHSANVFMRRGVVLQSSSQSDSPAATSTKVNSDIDTVTWSDIELPLLSHTESNNFQILKSINQTYVEFQNLNIYQDTDSQEKEEESDNFVNKTPCVRKKSSTRGDFLEISKGKIDFNNSDNIILSASSAFHSNTSEMGDSDSSVGHADGDKGSPKLDGASSSPKLNSEDISALIEAVGKIDLLTTTVLKLENTIHKQGQRLELLEESARSSQESSQEKKKKCKSKKERVSEEKERQLKVVREKLNTKAKESSSSEEEVSDVGVNLKNIKKKLSKKDRDQCNGKVALTLKNVGAVFPEDDFSTSSNSGKESESDDGACRHKKKVKSGAKVKKRPVVKTLLWPHTIANEEDGDDTNSENISLSKFLSCFTFIMASCNGLESRGRSVLLHAVSLVLEYVQWSEARTFHNLIMVKLEQDRLNWASDFMALAEGFIDKKVRLSLKSKYTPGGANSYGKASYFNKGSGKNFKSPSQRSSAGKGKPLFGAICWQWNYSTCTYGDECKRWHVCKSCAEAGKLGEHHKASSHESPGYKAKPRV